MEIIPKIMNLTKRANVTSSLDFFWYLPVGIFWVFFLNSYASNPDKQIQQWFALHNNPLWHQNCVWAAIGLSVIASLIYLIAFNNNFLRIRLAAIAILGISASALLMVGGFIPRFVFGAFFIVLITLGITFFKAQIQTSPKEDVKKLSSKFLQFSAIILTSFFVVLLLDVGEFRKLFFEYQTFCLHYKDLAYDSCTSIMSNMLAPALINKAQYSVFGLIAYSIVGMGIVAWVTFLPQNSKKT
jgi:hypothetical protein